MTDSTRQPTCGSPPDPRMTFFDELAPRWDEVGQDPAETVRLVAEHRELLGLKPGEDLLEVGCGTGQLTGWLAEQVAPGRVVAVDFAASMLELARRKHPSVGFQHADACHDDLGRDCYDVILCFHSFPHFRDQAAAIGNFAQSLRAGGRLLVMHLAGAEEVNAFHDGVGGVITGDHLPPAPAWTPMLEHAGFALQQLIDRPGLFFLQAVRGA